MRITRNNNDDIKILEQMYKEQKVELEVKLNDAVQDRDSIVEHIKTIDEKYLKEKEMLSKIHQQEMEAGRKKLLELEGGNRTKMGRIKELEGQMKDLDAKYRDTKAKLMNRIHDLEHVKKENQQAMENQLREFDALYKERDQIFQEKAATEEKLRQIEQAVEDYERQISSLEKALREEGRRAEHSGNPR